MIDINKILDVRDALKDNCARHTDRGSCKECAFGQCESGCMLTGMPEKWGVDDVPS